MFAGEAVREASSVSRRSRPGSRCLRTQGLYKRNRFRTPDSIAAARVRLRQRLGIPADALVVLAVGYADARKGADLFVEAGTTLVRGDARVHLVWLGHHDDSLWPELQSAMAASGCAGNFHFPGRDADTDPWYAGADLYALTSREDPFPTVIMEALDVGVPVVAFAGAGGFDAMLGRAGGRLVPMLDTAAFAAACAGLLADPQARQALGERGRALVEAEFDFPTLRTRCARPWRAARRGSRWWCRTSTTRASCRSALPRCSRRRSRPSK